MGAIKPNNYTKNELNIALIADAISHPLRARMIEILSTNQSMRNIDFVNQFKMARTTIHNHLSKLKQAGLIDFEYSIHFYEVKLQYAKFDDLQSFINLINNCKN